MSTFKDDLELLKFMIDKHNEEARLYWIGMNVFLVIDVGALSYIISGILESRMHYNDSLAFVSVLGAILTAAWLLVALRQEHFFSRWKKDAWNLAKSESRLVRCFYHFFGDKIKENFGGEVAPKLSLLRRLHTVKVMWAIIVITFLMWAYLFIAVKVPDVRLFKGPRISKQGATTVAIEDTKQP
jgi:hypothetical protein